jgi:hypothetical protein
VSFDDVCRASFHDGGSHPLQMFERWLNFRERRIKQLEQLVANPEPYEDRRKHVRQLEALRYGR